MTERNGRPSRDQFLGCLLGGAIGDALGYPIEFRSLAEIKRAFGDSAPQDLPGWPTRKAEVSDDTQMTLFTAEGIIRANQRFKDRGIVNVMTVIQGSLLRWLATQTGDGGERWTDPMRRGWLLNEPRLHARRAPGTTCLSSLQRVVREGEVPTVQHPPNASKGCGAVMRSAPLGLAARDREQAFEWGRDAGVLTHGHPSGYLAAGYLASMVYDVVRGSAVEAAMTAADDLLRGEPGHEELAEAIDRARATAKLGVLSAEAVEQLGGGWVGEEALAIAIACTVTAKTASQEDVSDALWRAVAHSGDSDSTGSITGNLLGAVVGARRLPVRWVGEIELGDVVERVADDLYETFVAGKALDQQRYPPN